MAETPVVSTLLMDRSEPIGNSPGNDSRRALHALVKNSTNDPIPVNSTPADGVSVYGEAAAVVNGIETNVVTYTVPAGKKLFLSAAEMEGDNVAAFRVKQDGTTIARARFSYTQFTGRVSFEALPSAALLIPAGVVLTVAVYQEARESSGNYSARILGVLLNE